MDISFSFESITWVEAIFRVLLALLFSFFLGYDRNRKNKPIDYRAYMIVAVTTCLLAMMGQELVFEYENTTDNAEFGLLRIVQGVLTGIGFLGAGAILKTDDKHKIIGTATGATIWGAGSMGLMIGFGMYGLAIIGFVVLLSILIIFGFLKKPLFDEKDKIKREEK